MAPEAPAGEPAPRYFTWDEVAQRSGRERERWLVVERRVYDISDFVRRHPGGSRVISHYAGQDATVSCAGLGWAALGWAGLGGPQARPIGRPIDLQPDAWAAGGSLVAETWSPGCWGVPLHRARWMEQRAGRVQSALLRPGVRGPRAGPGVGGTRDRIEETAARGVSGVALHLEGPLYSWLAFGVQRDA